VIESGRSSGLKGKTPEATVATMLAVGSKPGGSFKRVDKATYALADELVEFGSCQAEEARGEAPPEANGGPGAGSPGCPVSDTRPRFGGSAPPI
jgi:hypothetical protein